MKVENSIRPLMHEIIFVLPSSSYWGILNVTIRGEISQSWRIRDHEMDITCRTKHQSLLEMQECVTKEKPVHDAARTSHPSKTRKGKEGETTEYSVRIIIQ